MTCWTHPLSSIYQQGIIHRDIKPGNLLLGADGLVKVLDMGLARLEERLAGGRGTATEGLPQTGDVLGTLDYMAPEQLVDTRHVGPAADIYSLGCTLHYLLVGKPPYDGRTVSEKLVGHRKQPVPSLRTASPEVPDGLDRLFQRMLAKRPEDRPAGMAEVIAALASFAGATSDAADATQTCEVVPRSGARGTASRRLIRPRRVAIVLGMIAVVALFAFAGIFLLRMPTPAGTLIVEVSQPGATVEIIDPTGTVKLTDASGDGPLVFQVEPGSHQVKVAKDGFEFFTQDVTIKRREAQTVRVVLEPKEEAGPLDARSSIEESGDQPLASSPVVPELPLAPSNDATVRSYQEAWAKYLDVSPTQVGRG